MGTNKKLDDPKCNSIRQQLRMLAFKEKRLRFYNWIEKKKITEKRVELLEALREALEK